MTAINRHQGDGEGKGVSRWGQSAPGATTSSLLGYFIADVLRRRSPNANRTRQSPSSSSSSSSSSSTPKERHFNVRIEAVQSARGRNSNGGGKRARGCAAPKLARDRPYPSFWVFSGDMLFCMRFTFVYCAVGFQVLM